MQELFNSNKPVGTMNEVPIVARKWNIEILKPVDKVKSKHAKGGILKISMVKVTKVI